MVEGTILIVDDDTDHLGLVDRYASAYGVKQATVTGAEEAISFLEVNPVDVVVTDMVMPDMDGMQLLLHIKEHYPSTDVIVMTGYSQDYSYIDVIQAGATDFISKPFSKNEFFAKLERALRERQILRELTVAKEKAEASAEAKSDFIHRISHEFKTPLTNIVGFTELLIATDVVEKSKEYKEIVLASVERLTSLIDQLLEFSKFAEKSYRENRLDFNVVEVFAGITEDFGLQSQAKGLSLRYTIDPSLREIGLRGECVAVTTILKNLVKNGITFSDKGEVHIEATIKEHLSEEAVLLQFAVHDSGCGIPEDKMALIFEPFTQVEEFLTRQHDGAGLGLAICAKLINTLGGEIWGTSTKGEGSTFYFTLEMSVKS